jgi:hypothetical protein
MSLSAELFNLIALKEWSSTNTDRKVAVIPVFKMVKLTRTLAAGKGGPHWGPLLVRD